MNLILPLRLSYALRLNFIIDIECTHGGYLKMEARKEIFFQIEYIFISSIPTIFVL